MTMTLEELKKYLKHRENERLEFKESKNKLDRSSFDTICAFLNNKGGILILGVDDNGIVKGINKDKIESIKKDIITTSNNWQKLNPPFILYPEVFNIDNKIVIAVRIPVSSQVHKCNNTIFDRSNDSDLRVTQSQQIDEIYQRKRNYFTENEIYPYLKKEHLREDLLRKSRNLIKSHNPDHTWLDLNDEQLMLTSGLYATDFKTGKTGYTLAAALLFGQDIVIQQILPQYRIDAMVRIENLDRYDDRKIIQTNLIEAYEQLMGFVDKHLDDKFYMEGDTRVSLREKIFREVIANLIVHREYTNAQTATFIIYKDRVELKNANNPKDFRNLEPGEFEPYQKNPNIARFFRAIGRGEEIGSGVRNVNKYLSIYAKGNVPVFKEDSIFTAIIPLSEKIIKRELDRITDGAIDGVVDGAIDGATQGVKNKLSILLQAIINNEGKRVPDYLVSLNVSERTLERYIEQLRIAGLIEFRGDAAQTGGYYLTEKVKKSIK